MAKRRQIQRGLLKNSIAAYLSAIEIHNKPNIAYRYETATLLMVNAWELLLKAYVWKYTKHSIFAADGTTIKFTKALQWTREQLKVDDPLSFDAAAENLVLLDKYRNDYIHYYSDNLNPVIFVLLAKAAENYTVFYERHFGKSPVEGCNLHILPLGFELPFEPEAFLSKSAPQRDASKEAAAFIDSITHVTAELNERGVSDSVVIGFDVHFASAKKIDNANLLARIEKIDGIPFTRESKIRLSSEKGAAPTYYSDEQFFEMYPLEYKELTKRCREKIEGFKEAAKYHSIRHQYIEPNAQFAAVKKLNRDGSNHRIYYTEQAVEEVGRRW